MRTFAARSTALPEGAELLTGERDVAYPGRNQSRTVVQGLVSVPKTELDLAEVGEHRSYNLLIDGEILRRKELFDHFRYRFSFPADVDTEQIPLVVQRYLRPGQSDLIVKVEDMVSKRVFREERTIDVPRVERAIAPPAASLRPEPSARAEPSIRAEPSVPAELAATATAPAAVPPSAGIAPATSTRRFSEQLGEANASISTGDYTMKVTALPEVLTVGKLRVEAPAAKASPGWPSP